MLKAMVSLDRILLNWLRHLANYYFYTITLKLSPAKAPLRWGIPLNKSVSFSTQPVGSPTDYLFIPQLYHSSQHCVLSAILL